MARMEPWVPPERMAQMEPWVPLALPEQLEQTALSALRVQLVLPVLMAWVARMASWVPPVPQDPQVY